MLIELIGQKAQETANIPQNQIVDADQVAEKAQSISQIIITSFNGNSFVYSPDNKALQGTPVVHHRRGMILNIPYSNPIIEV